MQALEAPCALLIIAAAVRRGGAPGTLYLLEPGIPAPEALPLHEARDHLADTHYATPRRALAFARSLGRAPAGVRTPGGEPVQADDIGLGLSAPVAAAVEPASARLRDLVTEARR